MCEKLLIMCNSCQNILKEFDTSPTVTDVGKKRMVGINLWSVVATTSIGGGLAALRKVCTNFNFMQPVHEKQYNNYLKYIAAVVVNNADECLSVAVKNLRQVVAGKFVEDDVIVDVAVSVDGSWQKKVWA